MPVSDFFSLIYHLSAASNALATSVHGLNDETLTSLQAFAKQPSQPSLAITQASPLANPKLKLSTKLTDVQFVAIHISTDPKARKPDNNIRPILIRPILNTEKSMAGLSSANGDENWSQTRGTIAEMEFANENRMLLGLTIIFVSGLMIAYFVSRYRQLF